MGFNIGFSYGIKFMYSCLSSNQLNKLSLKQFGSCLDLVRENNGGYRYHYT